MKTLSRKKKFIENKLCKNKEEGPLQLLMVSIEQQRSFVSFAEVTVKKE